MAETFLPFISLVIAFLLEIINQCSCDPRATEAALICTNRKAAASDRQTYVPNFLAAMSAITPLVSRQGYGAVSRGSGNNTVYAFGACMKDLSQADCNLCVAQCKTQILRCLPFQLLTTGGRLFYDGCYLRYDDYMFFNETTSLVDKVVCGNRDFGGNRSLFEGNVRELVRNMSLEGGKNGGFFTGEVTRGNLSVYGLAQCWEFVNGSVCQNCLNDSKVNIDSCPPKDEGRVLNTACYMRYSTQKFFYNNTATPSLASNRGGSRRVAIILGSVFSVVALLLILAFVAFFSRRKARKKRLAKKRLGVHLLTVNKSKLNFSYETLEKATNYFSNASKLGQGGSGSVYKGILPNGQPIAVKRLFFHTTQWVDHFFNEVNLITDVNHKNLVKLLGCSITGPESLLVYEYVPNGSLHEHIFGRNNSQPLRWQERFNIILGTAEGLAFLHEESKMRIIHRDIKLSNVLLDDDLQAKVADFGLARLFPEDESHISTALAGTLGYMAPEYVVRGKLTAKADVYSFGVLVIEVVSGRKNTSVADNTFSILQKIWTLYGEKRLPEGVDRTLQGKFREEEASRLLQIGLLCVQASAESRPIMSIVVKMLKNQYEIPEPTQPPFLTSSTGEINPLNRRIGSSYFQSDSYTQSSGNDMTDSFFEPR